MLKFRFGIDGTCFIKSEMLVVNFSSIGVLVCETVSLDGVSAAPPIDVPTKTNIHRIRQWRRATTSRLMFFNGCRRLFSIHCLAVPYTLVYGYCFIFNCSCRRRLRGRCLVHRRRRTFDNFIWKFTAHMFSSTCTAKMKNRKKNKNEIYEKRVKRDNVYNTLLHAICLIRCSAYEY